MKTVTRGYFEIEDEDHLTKRPSALELFDEISDIYRAHRNGVYRRALMMVRNASEAEDLTQEAFLRLCAKRNAGEQIENSVAWVNTVVKHLVIDAAKRSRIVHQELFSNFELAEIVHETEAGIEERMIEQERLQDLQNAVSALNEKGRACVLMYARGMNCRQIATALDMPYWRLIATLKANLAKLKRKIEKRPVK
ncbi:MAG: sigma-70 family RNA polymerase sigma factor [Acidobacteriaceae bacterium]|jgi:RNA polymerase sigma-70 factor (ECF subfamily)